MKNIIEKLKNKFKEDNRENNFGNFLNKMQITGFRGIKDLEISFDFPITVISGINGIGKSTIGQLALCAYKNSKQDKKRFYIRDFFPILPNDKPVDENASVIYNYETKKQKITVTRSKSSWNGYKRMPKKAAYYIGFSIYLPKFEKKDLTIYGKNNISISNKKNVPEKIINALSEIITEYRSAELFNYSLKNKKNNKEVAYLERNNNFYSENNMGFGEARAFYIIKTLEDAPEKSLFVIEEPEIALHESAQYKIGKYFLDVCNRKGHQIIITTHSSKLLESLPQQASKVLIRNNKNDVEILSSVFPSFVQSILSDGYQHSAIILVEDKIAELILREALRIKNKNLLKTLKIEPTGSKDEVRQKVESIKKIFPNKIVIGVRDGDAGEDKTINILKLPGSSAPEVEIFKNKKVLEFIKDNYDIDIENMMRSKNHHRIFKEIHERCKFYKDENIIKHEIISYFVKQNIEEFNELIMELQKRVVG